MIDHDRRVLVVGDVMTDIIVRPEGPLVVGSDRRATIRSRPGGSGANQAVWLGAMGADVRLVARVGAADRPGLDRYFRGVGVSPVLSADNDLPSGVLVTVLDPNGERSFLTDRGANLALSPADLPETLLDGTALVVVSGYSFFCRGPPNSREGAFFGRPIMRHYHGNRRRFRGLSPGSWPRGVSRLDRGRVHSFCQQRGSGVPVRYYRAFRADGRLVSAIRARGDQAWCARRGAGRSIGHKVGSAGGAGRRRRYHRCGGRLCCRIPLCRHGGIGERGLLAGGDCCRRPGGAAAWRAAAGHRRTVVSPSFASHLNYNIACASERSFASGAKAVQVC